ncbi:MAG: type VI secretion system accessory protein TagJ [Betaproteobacteria bacterium]
MADSERVSALAVDLAGELKRLQGEVRAHPEDAKLRTYLFQLLAVNGDWQRALNQLQVCAQLAPSAIPMAQTYREAIRCEVYRAEVFAGKRTPQILGEPPPWMGLIVESLDKLAHGHVAAAEALRADALDLAPAAAGTIDGKPFAWIADADSRLGPVCEAIIDGKYYWVPFERIVNLKVDAPTDLRDFVWVGAHFKLSTDAVQVALIPARYPGTEAADKEALRLGRMTTWAEAGPETFVGLGQRMWATDVGEFALLDTREITFAAEA